MFLVTINEKGLVSHYTTKNWHHITKLVHILLKPTTGNYTETLKLKDCEIVYAYFSGNNGISITAEYYPTVKEFIKELKSKCE